MRLFFIRYIKIAFTYLQLHRLFSIFSGVFSNLFYLAKFSAWANKHGNIEFNDFPSKWDYKKRYALYKWVLEKEHINSAAINYLEFGVANGESFNWFLKQNTNVESTFHGFDTFTGLPEDWGPYKKGSFDNGNKAPEQPDPRGKFYQGLFQQTLPGFLPALKNNRQNIIMMDADLYSATLYVLSSIAPFLKKNDIIFFDEFSVPTHEFKAYLDFIQAYYINLQLIAATNNYYFVAFKVI